MTGLGTGARSEKKSPKEPVPKHALLEMQLWLMNDRSVASAKNASASELQSNIWNSFI